MVHRPKSNRLQIVIGIAAAAVATLILLAPALWNGFPLLQYDTGGYLARWYEGTLEESRSTVYGLFLNLLAWPDFWPAAAVQAALAVWIIGLVLRVHGLGKPPVLIVTVAVLAVATSLPWLADVLITDIFAGLSVLALHLLVFDADVLARSERWALFAFIAFSAATHSAALAVLLALIAAGLLLALFDRRVSFPRLGLGAMALGLSAALLLGANYAVAHRLAWTPGGIALVFGRLLQDGIVKRYLDARCPDPRFRLCDHLTELPDDADVFFWGEGLFNQLGRFEGMRGEMETIVLESFVAYPQLQVTTALEAWGKQLVMVRTGAGVSNAIWHTYGMIENFLPQMYAAMKAARQQQDELGFEAINRAHVPVALASMALLFAVIALGLKRRRYADIGCLAATTVLAILASAFVFGVLSGPHDRYGARIVWIATLAVIMVPWRAVADAGKTG